jgi:uncharacterized membrane protein HdeD (DUF308 family)
MPSSARFPLRGDSTPPLRQITRTRTINMDFLLALGTAVTWPLGVLDSVPTLRACFWAHNNWSVAETVMSSVHAHVQEISINRIRQQAQFVMRGYSALVLFPLMALGFAVDPIVRDLPRFDEAKLASTELWALAGLFALAIAAYHACRVPICKRCLRGLIAVQTVLLFAGGAVLVLLATRIDWAQQLEIERERGDMLTSLAAAGILVL